MNENEVSFAERVTGFGTSVFTEMNVLANQYDTINLGQGRPDFDGPQSMLEVAANSITDGQANQYPPGLGVPILKERLAEHAEQFYGLSVDPVSEIQVTVGASGGLFCGLLGIVNPGDEVIVIEPYFDIYVPQIMMAGGVPVYVPLRAPEWKFDFDEMRAAFNENTRAIVLNSPHNPTGRVFTIEELALIAELCQEYDVIALSDEVYEHLLFDDRQHIPIATLPGMFERTLTISSAAKTFSATGWKVGWVMGAAPLVTGAWRVHQLKAFAVNHPGQIGVAHALNLGGEYYAEFQRMYEHKRTLMMQALEAGGLKADAPEGSFYVMADYSDVYDGSDVDFAKYLVTDIGIVSIPPATFYCDEHRHLGKNYVRFSFCHRDETLEKSAERLAKLRQ